MVLDKMKDILVEQLECNPEDITMESLLVDDLGADSLDAIDIVMSVEDTFKVEVPVSAWRRFSPSTLLPSRRSRLWATLSTTLRITSDLHFSPFVNSCQKSRQKV